MVCKIICPILKPKKELKTVYLFDIHEKEIENIDLYLNNIPETDLKFINKITLKRNHFIKGSHMLISKQENNHNNYITPENQK